MEDVTILKTIYNGFCIACGVCAACCPRESIKMVRRGGEVLPTVDRESCMKCGICLQVCSANQIARYDRKKSLIDNLIGDYQKIMYVQAKDKKVLQRTTSGGFVTQTVRHLLERGEFICAFLVGGKATNELLSTDRVTDPAKVIEYARSKYLTVSQEKTIAYMLRHRDEKIILVGCGCTIQSILNVITLHSLKRENYFLIGLFCDKTMNYGVVNYFAHHKEARNKELDDIYFRTKLAGGWPGNLRLVFTDGTFVDLPIQERGDVKDYFMPERCLYCMDKLNRGGDIAVGDNYIKKNASSDGGNSIIIRTKAGLKVWEEVQTLFVFHKDEKEDLIESQVLYEKQKNYVFACEKGIYQGENAVDSSGLKRLYKEHIRKIELAKSENIYEAVHKDIVRRKRKTGLIWTLKQPLRKIKRMFTN